MKLVMLRMTWLQSMKPTLKRYVSCLWFENDITFYLACFPATIQVLAELPSPVTGGTMLTVEDFQQEFVCHINIKHRFLPNSIFVFLNQNCTLYQILKNLVSL